MPKLNIIIKGVALAYQKDDEPELWKVLLPFGGLGDCHHVRFQRGGGTPIPVAGTKGQIIIAATSAVSSATPGDQFGNFINLTDPGWGHAILEMKSGWDDHTVLMTIEDAVFSQHEVMNCRWGVKEGNDVKQEPAQVAYSAVAEIEAEEFNITIPGVDGFPITITGDETITIDNTCGQYNNDDSGDLKMLYEQVIYDPAGREFTIVRHPDDEPLKKSGAGVLAPSDNPPQFAPGLPCNIWVATETDGLE